MPRALATPCEVPDFAVVWPSSAPAGAACPWCAHDEFHRLVQIVELFCDLLLARHMLLESEPLLPPELQEAVYSICWAATRTEISDLAQAKYQFMLKYPEVRGQFAPAQPGAPQPAQTSYVNKKLMEYLDVATPPRTKVTSRGCYYEQNVTFCT